MFAKTVKIDGFLSKDELRALIRHLIIPNNEIKNVERIWNLTKSSVHGFESYAYQISELLNKKSIVLEKILHLLFFIAD